MLGVEAVEKLRVRNFERDGSKSDRVGSSVTNANGLAKGQRTPPKTLLGLGRDFFYKLVRWRNNTSSHVRCSRASQKGIRMPKDDQWITTRVAEARKYHPLVTEAVWGRIGPLLNGELSERPLPPARLTAVAKALIADMAPAPPRAEATQ